MNPLTSDQMKTLQHDLARIADQESRLHLPHFNEAIAWDVGLALKRLAEARGHAVTIEIRLAHELVFFHAMPGTTPANADWARRKRNTVELLHRSSYAVGRSLALEGSSLETMMGLPARDYASHGGSFPVRLAGGACVGTVTVSGLPQREDHALVVEVLALQCDMEPTAIALD